MEHDARYAALCDRARDLIPVLAERAEQTEELRRLPPDTLRDLDEAGLFRMLQPAKLGGAELDLARWSISARSSRAAAPRRPGM